MHSRFKINACLVLIAAIWGFGFVPQKLGMHYLGPAAFNFMRFALGALALMPVIYVFSRNTKSFNNGVTQFGMGTVRLGMFLGALLFIGALMQQFALLYTSVANVAFITGLYVIIVPMIGFFLGLRYATIVWIGGVLAIIGLYLMTGGGDGASSKGDIIALVGAVAWAAHILVLARKAGQHQQLVLSVYQFGFCAIFSLMYALSFEELLLPKQTIGYLWPAINGFIVVGVGYTLQVLVMDKAEPFEASLILSLEAVFGAIAGYLIFSEVFSNAALLGAVLILMGCVLAQLPQKPQNA